MALAVQDVVLMVFLSSVEGNHEHKITIASSGEGKPHNNMQPYDVIYRWRRTA